MSEEYEMKKKYNIGTNNPNYRHGLKSHKKVYQAWIDARFRCNNKNARNYHRYGGRGITVCERWQKFENFLDDMGDPPKGLSLERIDNNKGYCPENCKWGTPLEQTNNRYNTTWLTYKGITKTIKQWANEFNLNTATLRSRIKKKWPEEQIFSKHKFVANQSEKRRVRI